MDNYTIEILKILLKWLNLKLFMIDPLALDVVPV